MTSQPMLTILALSLGLGMLAAAAPLAAQAPAAGATPSAASAEAPARAARVSWTADRREFVVGDILTVLIDEQTIADATRSHSASDRRSRELDLGGGGGLGATTLPSVSAGVGTRNDAASRNRGDLVRSNSMRAEISVRVVALGPNGTLQVRGEKTLGLEKNQEKLLLAGWVRAQDVTAGNTVDSWRLADAQLTYQGRGGLNKPQGGLLSRLLGALWP